MKRKTIRILAIMLCLALCLAGCGAPGAPAASGGATAAPPESGPGGADAGGLAATGKYVESNITPPLSAGQTLCTAELWPDGTLYAIVSDDAGLTCFTTADQGATWRQGVSVRFEDVHAGRKIQKDLAAALPDGSMYYLCRLEDSGAGEVHLYRVLPDGTSAELPVAQLSEHNELGEALWLYDLRTRADGKLLLRAMVFPAGQEGYDSGVYKLLVIDPETGACEREFSLAGGMDGVFGESAYYELGFDGQLLRYEYAGGTSQPLGMLDNGLGGDPAKSSAMAVEDEAAGTFAILTNNDLRLAAPGGALTEVLCSGGGYMFSDPRNAPYWLAAAEDGDFYAIYQTDVGRALYRYTYDSTAANVTAKNTLTVWALKGTDTLRSAVAAFAQAHPETDVRLELGHASKEDGVLDSDIITALNTRLIAGDAPDVLILDGLPANGYIQKGALLDLSGLVGEEGYFANILNTWKTDGGTWAYPAFARLPMLIADPALGLAPASLAELAEAVEKGPALEAGAENLPLERQALLATMYFDDLFDTLYPAASGAIFPDGASLDENALHEFYAALDAIARKHGISFEEPTAGVLDSNDSDYVLSFQQIYMLEGTGSAAVALVRGVDTLTTIIACRGGAPVMMPGNFYLPVLSAAVPAKAAQPELAKEFIRTALLSGSVQNELSGMGLPVSRDGLASMRRQYEERMREMIALEGEEFAQQAPYYEEAFAVDYAALLEQAKVRGEQSVLLRDTVRGCAESLVRGESTVDEAVEQTAGDVRLYFAEQG